MNLRFIFCFLAGFACHSARAADDRPSIVLVMADDQGWGDMAYNGHPVVKTPNFDEAAATGLRFDRFYAAAPVCSPTRVSVLTGRHPNRIGVFQWGHTLRPQEVTLAEALKSAGYATGHFGKWHLGSVRSGSPVHPGASGFDEWLSAPNFYDNDPILSHKGAAVALEGESSMVAADAAIDWMKEKSAEEAPFLAVIWFGSPHSPHRAAEDDRQLYDDQPKNVANFLGEITGMDRAFGKIRRALSDLGIRENTILWYCSDNGALPKVGSAGEFRGRKGDCYEGGLLVPAILEWPDRIPEPRITDARCSSSDIYPTLLEIAGATVKDQPPVDGRSLGPLIDGQRMPSREIGFWDAPVPGIGTPAHVLMKELFNAQQQGRDLPPSDDSLRAAEIDPISESVQNLKGHAAWIDGDWKLHRIANSRAGEAKFEFYNLADDPGETVDLSDAGGEDMQRCRRRLETWMRSVVESLGGQDY